MSIKEIRENSNLSLEDVALMCGLDVPTVIECENNSKYKNLWAMSIILETLGLDYDNSTI